LHRARWIFKLQLGADNDTLDQLLENCTGISKQQIDAIHIASDWFWRARTWLHLAAGRLSDVLITNYQDRIAQELNGCSAQEWLSQHYAHSEKLAGFHEMAVRALMKGPSMAQKVLLENGYLHLQDNSPNQTAAINMFLVAQRYSIPVSLNDLNQLDEARASALEIKDPSDEEVWAFNQALNGNQGVAAFLRALSKFGILDRFIPNYSERRRIQRTAIRWESIRCEWSSISKDFEPA
jgi:UTP:GlnB (protein PII) uridylyltransferase